MNLVAVLITPAIVSFALGGHTSINHIIAVVAMALIIIQMIRARRAATAIV
jgi:hypothetical protein